MSHERPRIPRHSPELILHIGEVAYIATYENTVVCAFRHYSLVDHIHLTDQSLGYEGRIFDRTRDIIDLLRLEYPYHYSPYPSDEDLDAYERWQADKLDTELDP